MQANSIIKSFYYIKEAIKAFFTPRILIYTALTIIAGLFISTYYLTNLMPGVDDMSKETIMSQVGFIKAILLMIFMLLALLGAIYWYHRRLTNAKISVADSFKRVAPLHVLVPLLILASDYGFTMFGKFLFFPSMLLLIALQSESSFMKGIQSLFDCVKKRWIPLLVGFIIMVIIFSGLVGLVSMPFKMASQQVSMEQAKNFIFASGIAVIIAQFSILMIVTLFISLVYADYKKEQLSGRF